MKLDAMPEAQLHITPLGGRRLLVGEGHGISLICHDLMTYVAAKYAIEKC